MTPSNLAAARTSCTGVQVADLPPPIRLVPPEDDAAPAPPARRKLPKNLDLPAPTMQTIWCRFSIGGIVYRRSTECRDLRNAERRAVQIRAEIEAELRGIAAPQTVLLDDAIKAFERSLLSGRGGADR